MEHQSRGQKQREGNPMGKREEEVRRSKKRRKREREQGNKLEKKDRNKLTIL